MQEENGNVTKPVEVSVVDVDSITQAKQKIIDEVYKDRPYSECPKPDDLEFGKELYQTCSKFSLINFAAYVIYSRDSTF